jgi:hypothetical protein
MAFKRNLSVDELNYKAQDAMASSKRDKDEAQLQNALQEMHRAAWDASVDFADSHFPDCALV